MASAPPPQVGHPGDMSQPVKNLEEVKARISHTTTGAAWCARCAIAYLLVCCKVNLPRHGVCVVSDSATSLLSAAGCGVLRKASAEFIDCCVTHAAPNACRHQPLFNPLQDPVRCVSPFRTAPCQCPILNLVPAAPGRPTDWRMPVNGTCVSSSPARLVAAWGAVRAPGGVLSVVADAA